MRVLLADDHQLLLEGLRNLLVAHGIDVVDVARNGLECLEKARAHHPDIILMDLAMPGCDGLCATRLVKSEMPEIKVVMLSAGAEDHDLFEAVKCGATGFLLKSMAAAELIEALENALHDVPPLAPGLAGRLLAEFARTRGPDSAPTTVTDGARASFVDTRPESDDGLTARQEEVLALLAEGLSYKEVAAKVSLSPRTVKYHMGEIMRKLHLTNRAQVLAYAGRVGLSADHVGHSARGPVSPR